MVAFTGVGKATVDTKHPKGAETSVEELDACHKTDAKNDRQNETEWRRNDEVVANVMKVSARVRKQNLRFNTQLVNMAKIAILGA
jgi:hypothetical protein